MAQEGHTARIKRRVGVTQLLRHRCMQNRHKQTQTCGQRHAFPYRLQRVDDASAGRASPPAWVMRIKCCGGSQHRCCRGGRGPAAAAHAPAASRRWKWIRAPRRRPASDVASQQHVMPAQMHGMVWTNQVLLLVWRQGMCSMVIDAHNAEQQALANRDGQEAGVAGVRTHERTPARRTETSDRRRSYCTWPHHARLQNQRERAMWK